MQSQIEALTFGVEIETIVPTAASVRSGHYHSGIGVEHAVANGISIQAPQFYGALWKAERDSSIIVDKPGYVAAEFISPILKGEAGVRHLVEFLKFLHAIGARVNSSCGLHIHVGAQSAAAGEEITAYVDKLTRLVAFNSKALYAQTGTLSRETGQFCRPLGDSVRRAVRKAKKTKALRDAATGAGRYQLLNLTNLPTRGTVEFRCFAGTTNTSKVLLHLFSALALVIIARKAKTPHSWDNRPLTGTKALTNFLKVRPMVRIVGTEVFAANFPKLLRKALEMAGKYDTQQAALDAIRLSTAAR